MIICFLGNACDSEQVKMLVNVEDVDFVDVEKIELAVENVKKENDVQDWDYEDIINEAMENLGYDYKFINPSTEIQL